MNRTQETPGSSPPPEPLPYRLERMGTGQGVGYFSCVPEGAPSFEEALSQSRDRPYDQFLHKHLLGLLQEMDVPEVEALAGRGLGGDPHLLALVYETYVLQTKFSALQGLLEPVDPATLAPCSPLLVIPWSEKEGKDAVFYWLRLFSRNAHRMEPLPDPGDAEHPIPWDRGAIAAWSDHTVSLGDICPARSPGRRPLLDPPPRDRVKDLVRTLEQRGILTGWEARTEATLSPFAVERPWALDIRVKEGRNRWRLRGTLTSYGRGLNIHQGRISCAMEAVERVSAFAEVEGGRALGYQKEMPLLRGTPGALRATGYEVLDPDTLSLETPYRGQDLVWVQGERVDREGRRPLLLPAQCVFLFANFDEQALTSGLLSTGLGAGFTFAQAKRSALLEVLERDADKVIPFAPARCFSVDADDERVRELLRRCESKGISLQLMDITSEFGVPAYRAVVQGPNGFVLKGTGADLDGRRAALSAITEIPYPYPYWFGSMPPPPSRERIEIEDLPDYATGSAEEDVRLLEGLLLRNGYAPVYVDLTRADLGIPVCKALVPGLEMMTVLDMFTPLPLRQFGHYLRAFGP